MMKTKGAFCALCFHQFILVEVHHQNASKPLTSTNSWHRLDVWSSLRSLNIWLGNRTQHVMRG